MNRPTALGMLSASSSHERLKAARFLARHAEPGDLVALRQAKQVESVSYVKASLDSAIRRALGVLSPAPVEPDDESDVSPDVRRQIRGKAVQEVARLLLHEIASPIGLAAESASREIRNWEQSDTKRHVERVQDILDAISELKVASGVPTLGDVALHEVVAEVAEREASNRGVEVMLHGPRPIIIKSDRRLLTLALANGIRNAAEATLEIDPPAREPVVVTWDQTDVDNYVTVIDRGSGLAWGPEAAFEMGTSTKRGHSGFGLAIARQAMEALGGTAELRACATGGCEYSLRWGK